MGNIKTLSGGILRWLSLTIILSTGFLELVSPEGVFLSWGYIVGVLVALISENKGDIILSVMLSLVFVSISFFRIEDAAALRTILITRAYALLGLGFMGYFVVRYIKREMKTVNEKTLMSGIFSHGTQGIILTRQTGQIVMVNPFAERLFGFKPHTLIGYDSTKLFRQSANIGLSGYCEGLPKKLRAFRKDGSEFPIEVSDNQYQSGNELYIVHFITDITQRNADEEKLLMQKRELEIVNQQLESFSYSVSHDLRSPLRAVGGYAQMLAEDYTGRLDEEANRLLHNIQSNARRMGSLIDDLLTFSRLGRKEVHKSMINMYEVAGAALSELSGSINDAHVSIEPLPTVMADKSLMGNVMTNLLSNAIKYSSKREKPMIQISCVEEPDEIIFCVRDNGVGFDMKYVNKLFGVFQRLHLASEFEGTGVGLAIAHRIIQKHGGKMRAEGKEGEGAAFYFSLPIVTENADTKQTDGKEEYIVERTRFLGEAKFGVA
ncbi:MAG: PAS domain S-box protein [Cyclobacteriaceae bacterium]|nr:PAS domain S-box protein [Cyclobacteriaceae bacterium]